jgi:hypothetical protein
MFSYYDCLLIVACQVHQILTSHYLMFRENECCKPLNLKVWMSECRFRNDLPDSTAQPKLMHINTDKDRFVLS